MLKPSSALRLLCVGLHLLFGGLQTALLFPCAGPARRNALKRRWSRQLLTLLNIETMQGGRDLPRIDSGLLVANHVSFIDVFAINAVLPSGFIAKSEVATWPLIGWLSRRNDTVFIERGKRKAAELTRQKILEMLAKGKRLVIFPEGTTTTGEAVLPFHGALFQGAIDAAAPVHCLAIEYLDAHGARSTAASYVDELSVLDCLRNILNSGGLRVRLRLVASFAPPLPDRRHLAHSAHQAVSAALHGDRAGDTPQPLRNAAAISA